MAEAGGHGRHPGYSAPVAARWRPDQGGSSPGARRRRRLLFAGGLFVVLIGLLALILALIVPWATSEIPPLQWVGIGDSNYHNYPPRAGSEQDLASLQDLFLKLSTLKPKEYLAPVHIRDTVNETALRTAVERHLPAVQKGTALIYLSLHSLAGSDGTPLLIPNNASIQAVQNGVGAELIPLSEIIQVLTETTAEHVVLLLDVGRLRPDSRLGILGIDTVSALTKMHDSLKSGKLRILCSCSPGQESWTWPTMNAAGKRDEIAVSGNSPSPAASEGRSRSLFGFVIEEALRGKCDGWQPEHKSNERIDWLEFTSYVIAEVDRLAVERFGEHQQVLQFGPQAPFDLMLVEDLSKSAPAPAAETATTPSTPLPAAAPNSGSAAAVSSASPPAGPATAPDGPANQTARPAPLTLASLRNSLDPKWQQLGDTLLGDVTPADGIHRVIQQWRFLLMRAEAQWEAGLLDPCQITLLDLERLLSDAAAPAGEQFSSAFHPELLSTTWWSFDKQMTSTLPEASRLQFDKLTAEMIAAATAATPETAAPPARVPSAPAAGPPPPLSAHRERLDFARWLWDEVRRNRERSLRVGPLLTQLDKSFWPSSEWPMEFHLLARLSQRANRLATITSEARLLAAIDELHRVVPSLWEVPAIFAQVESDVREIQRCLLAAERWLLADPQPPDKDYGESWMKQAEDMLQRLQSTVHAWSTLTKLQLRTRRDWAAYADYFAAAAEEGGLVARTEALDSFGLQLERQPQIDSQTLPQLIEMWPVASENQNSPGPVLLRLLVELRELDQLSEDAASRGDTASWDEQKLTARSDRLRSHLAVLKQAVDDEVTRLSSRQNPTIDDHRQIRRVLCSSLLTDTALRRNLRSMLDSRPAGGLSGSPGNDADKSPQGVWSGFWSICQMQFAGAPPQADLWSSWRSLAVLVAKQSPEQMTARALMGYKLNAAWNDIEAKGNRSSAALLAGLPGHVGLDLSQVHSPIADRVFQLRRQMLSSLAYAWTGSPSLSPLLKRLRDERISFSEMPSSRWEFPAEVACTPERLGELQVAVDPGPANPNLALVLFDRGAGRARFKRGTSDVTVNKLIPISQNRVQLEIEALPDLVRTEDVGLALVEADGFPHDIRRLHILPPFDKSKFSVKFVTADKGIDVYTQVSGRDGSGGSRLFLPPLGESRLKAVLVRPEGDITQKMRVSCHVGTKDGPQLFSFEISLKPEQREVVIAPAAPEGPPATPPPAVPATPPPGADVAAGFVFWLEPDGQPDKGFEYRIDPEFWPADQYIEVPEPAIDDNKLVIDIVSKPPTLLEFAGQTYDRLSPKQVSVELNLSPGWRAPIRGPMESLQLPMLELGMPGQVFFEVDPQRLQDLEAPLEMYLSVAGWPHAFRWQVEATGVQRVTNPAVRISQPRNDLVLLPPQTGALVQDVELEVFGAELDAIGPNDRWTVEFTTNGGAGREWPVKGRVIRNVQASLDAASGVLTVTTSATDFIQPLNLQGKQGRFKLDARLLKNGDVVARDTVQFAIDSTPPTVDFVNQTQLSRPHDVENPVQVSANARDDESRILRMRMGIDANGDGQLSPEEADWREYPDPDPVRDPVDRTLPRTFLTKDFPEKVVQDLQQKFSGQLVVIVEAENRISTDQTALKLARKRLTIPLIAKKPIVVAPPPIPIVGTLILNTNNRFVDVFVDGSKKEARPGKPIGPLELKVGPHVVKWKDREEQVDIQPGQTTTLDINF